jgi:sulfate adenylyltransferase subunit 2
LTRTSQNVRVIEHGRGKPPLDPHLKALENEAIHIIREVAAEFERPVMLYSIGKDSVASCCTWR